MGGATKNGSKLSTKIAQSRIGRVVFKKKTFSDMVRDPDGERRVKKIAEACRSSGKKFVDSEFPPDSSSLFIDEKNCAPSMSKIKKMSKDIQWLRPCKMGNISEPEVVFADGIEPEDINQGAIGSCYMLAALALCATRQELIEDLIVEDFKDDGIYGVKFNYMGKWQTIVVDDLFPCFKNAQKQEWMPIFARWKGEKETWAMIVEKAWAKLHGSYEAIEGGLTEDALGYLCGGCTSTTVFDPAREMPELHNGELWKRIVRDHQMNGRDMGCFISAAGVKDIKAGRGGLDNPDSVSTKEGGLVSGHAYSVLDVVEVQCNKLLQLRNPWGNYEWDGAWSDKSPLWTQSMKDAVGFVDADDGSFWMSYKDFYTNFGYIGVCKTIPSSWTSRTMNSAWKAPELAGGRRLPTSTYNPTFRLNNKDSSVWLMVQQPDNRGTLHDWKSIFLAVYKEPESDASPVDLSPVMKLQSIERSKTVELELDPKDGPFLIVVTTFHSGVEGEFMLGVYSPGAFDLEETNPAPPKDAEMIKDMTSVDLNVGQCVTCNVPVDYWDRESQNDVTWHARPSCYICAGCHVAFRTSADTVLHAVDIDKETRKWGGYCFKCWNDNFGERCVQCKEPLQKVSGAASSCMYMEGKGKFHIECEQALLASMAEVCLHCNEPVMVVPGKFTGKYMELEDPPGQVHSECFKSFRSSLDVKCIECGEVIGESEGQFSGSFFEIENVGQLHSECRQEYDKKIANVCVHCGEPCIPVEGRFSGSYFQVPGDGDNMVELHEECETAYQTSQATRCMHCDEAILQIEGRFTGAYFDCEGGRVHEECMDDWRSKSLVNCEQCHEPIDVVPERFSGSFRTLGDNGGQVHEECYWTFKCAQVGVCIQCSGPLMELEDNFSGAYFDIVGFGPVHKECIKAHEAGDKPSTVWTPL